MMIEHIDIAKPVLFEIDGKEMVGRVVSVRGNEKEEQDIVFEISTSIEIVRNQTVTFFKHIDFVWNEND